MIRTTGRLRIRKAFTSILATFQATLTKGWHRMATLGLIGSGRIGGTVAHLAVDAGYDVVLSNSRGPETLAELVEKLGPHARAATPAEAAAAGDLVVVSVPLKAYQDVPVEPLAGKVVIDTNNYYPDRDGHIPELDDKSATSSELLQRHLPASKVVKGFNNIYSGHLRTLPRPAGSPERSALPIAGDDAGAKADAAAFLDAIGYDAVDEGSLAESWRSEPGAPVYGMIYMPPGEADLTQVAPVPAGTGKIKEAVEAARR
jgi:predicted dinucleotide-binding enzyme